MKARFAIAVLLCCWTAAANAETPAWNVEAKESRIAFTAKQMGITIPGRFERFSATIRFDAGDLSISRAVIEIDVASATTPNRDIEVEIKREPWFDVERHPKARFETVSFTHKGSERYDIAGRLTLRGVTKDVTLPAVIRVGDDPGQPQTLRAQASGEITVSRTAFGIGQGQWRDTGVVADDVVIQFELVARRPKSGG